MRGYNPDEIVAQIKQRRISVLVSVPKILDVLRDHVAARSIRADARDAQRGTERRRCSAGGATAPFIARSA